MLRCNITMCTLGLSSFSKLQVQFAQNSCLGVVFNVLDKISIYFVSFRCRT